MTALQFITKTHTTWRQSKSHTLNQCNISTSNVELDHFICTMEIKILYKTCKSGTHNSAQALLWHRKINIYILIAKLIGYLPIICNHTARPWKKLVVITKCLIVWLSDYNGIIQTLTAILTWHLYMQRSKSRLPTRLKCIKYHLSKTYDRIM